MSEHMTAGEIHERFLSEWVLVGDPKSDDYEEVIEGDVLIHSRDREEVYRAAVALRPRHFAIMFTGTLPEGTALALPHRSDSDIPE